MTKTRGQKEAIALLQSPRGHYLVSEALFLALKSMMEEPEEEWPIYDMGDMMLMAIHLFPQCLYSDAVVEEDTLNAA